MLTLTLNDAAEVFQAHPRTILRALTNTPNPYWTEDHNPSVTYEDLAVAYACHKDTLRRVFEGRDSLLTPGQAAEELKIPPRTFRYRSYPSMRCGGIVRYSRALMLQRHFNKWET